MEEMEKLLNKMGVGICYVCRTEEQFYFEVNQSSDLYIKKNNKHICLTFNKKYKIFKGKVNHSKNNIRLGILENDVFKVYELQNLRGKYLEKYIEMFDKEKLETIDKQY